MKRTMESIGREKNTDKISVHGYHRFYPIFLEKFRDESIIMLEIGTKINCSIKLWEEYFPKSKIYGIDIDHELSFERGKIFKGDQSNTIFLNKVVSDIGEKLDFIIDDGSHNPEHQIKTFCHLFNHLKKGGIYIIEDIETSYWTNGICYGYKIQRGYKHPESVIEIFKDLIDRLNKEFIKDKSIFNSLLVPEEIQEKIGMITFVQNSIIILKKDEEYQPYDNREYRYKQNL